MRLATDYLHRSLTLLLHLQLRRTRPPPSSHAQFMFFFATYFSLLSTRKARVCHGDCRNIFVELVNWILTVLTMYSRVYLGYHSAVQVFAGSFAGIVLGASCFFAVYRTLKRVKDWGGIVVGKTNLDEFGMGSSTEGSAFQTRLQTQAAGAPYCHPLGNVISRMAFFGPTMMFADLRCSPSCARAGIQGTVSICPPDCFQYKGTFDTLYKIALQEGLLRLWRGTNAGLALAVPMVGIYLPCYDIFRDQMGTFVDANAPGLKPFVPLIAGSLARSLACSVCYPIDLAKTRMQAFKETGKKPPGVWRTLLGIISNVESTSSFQNRLQSYRVLWPGLGAQLACDVPFSAICWTTMEPIRRQLSASVGDEKTWALCFVLIFLPHFSLEALLLEQPVH